MRKTITLFLLGFPLFCLAQKTDTVIRYFNVNLESDTRENARFVGKAWEDKGIWTAYVFDASAKLIMKGQFKDRNLKIKEGRFIFFHENGNVDKIGNYENSMKTGTWVSYYENGNLKDSVQYAENVKRGLAIGWDLNGARRYEGRNESSHPEGTWTWFHANGTASTKEEYIKGKLSKLDCYDSTGKLTGHNCSLSTTPTIKGRYGGIQKYIIDSLVYPKEGLKKGLQGAVSLEFTLSKTGQPMDFKVISTPDPLLSDEVIHLIKSVPEWYPAVEHNVPVDYTFKLYVPFVLPETY